LPEIEVVWSIAHRSVMHCCSRSFAALLALGLVCRASSSASIPSVPDYKIGETARVDVVASFAFVSIDPAKTEMLKEKERLRVHTIYRFDTNATTEALETLREAFATNRENFLVALRSTFNRSVLDQRALTNQRFARFVTSVQYRVRPIPLTPELATIWAKGESDNAYIAPLEERLTALMQLHIRAEEEPPGARLGWQVKLVPGNKTNSPTRAQVERIRTLERRNNLLALGKLRTQLPKEATAEDKRATRFLASLLQPNCLPDVTLTRELRDEATAGLSSVNHFAAGDVIVHAGEVVTPGAKAALDEYRARFALLRGPGAVRPVSLAPWLWAGGATVIALSAVVIFWLRSRQRTMAIATLPESLGHDAAIALKNDPVIRARLTEHLTRLLGQTVVQRLFAQRGQLLDAHKTAAIETAEMEQRLEKVQSQMQVRFAAYEQRIADLEKELTAAEEQNRDLIRAKIALAKQELEAERARSRVDWN
jgi:hypothetical protein